jgi:VWFA-related protein
VEGETLSRLGDAVRAFSGALVPGDTASLVSFSRRLKLDALSVADPLAIRQALGGARAAGATAMWDALVAGAALVQDAPSPPLVVIFTDGADTYSYLDQKKASECLDRATAVVYAVRASRLAPPPALLQSGANVTIIDQPGDMLLAMASRTGGAVWPAAEGTDLSGQFVRVLQEFRSRYLLIYEPTGVRRDDGWHQVKVRVKDGRAEVKARPGYYATRRKGGTTDSQGARR